MELPEPPEKLPRGLPFVWWITTKLSEIYLSCSGTDIILKACLSVSISSSWICFILCLYSIYPVSILHRHCRWCTLLFFLFHSLYDQIFRPSKLQANADFHCFKTGVEPKWEDPECANGGKWSVTCNRKATLDTMWLETVSPCLFPFLIMVCFCFMWALSGYQTMCTIHAINGYSLLQFTSF